MANMGAISDVTSEFKQAGSKEKAVIIIGVIAVGGVAWYLYTHKQATGTQQGVLASNPPTGGTPMIGSTPFIGSNVNPLYDPAGNLVAFQGSPPPTTPIQGGNPPTTGPAPANWLGSIPNYSKVWAGGMNADGTQRYWFTPPGGAGKQTMFNVPQGTRVYAGGSGRWWYSPPGGSQTALTVNH